MAQLISVRLSRGDAQPWGLRLQGGKDFGTPLVIQKVTMGSISDQAGLVVGDALIKVNNIDAFNLRHKDAQDLIVKSGNSFEITVQRGGGTWRPSVTPTGAIPTPSPTPNYGQNIQTVTKTSLAHKQQDVKHIGSGYNNAARPFAGGNQNGGVPSIVNKQYNTPVGIYSEESIAETLSAQAEVLAGGVLGVNFKKNEKVYNSANSEVLKALQEAENEPAEPEDYTTSSPHHHQYHQQQQQHPPQPSPQHHQQQQQYHQQQNYQHQQQQQQQQHHHYHPQPQQQQHYNQQPIQQQQHQQHLQSSPQHNLRAVTPVTKHVNAPIDRPAPPATSGLPTGQNICAECERLIVGVFVRIKDKNLHVDCFKCATCGTSLKNQGYFNLNNKLYCDIHAKMAALNNPPPGTEGCYPVPIQPNTKLSASTISAALNAHHNLNGTAQNNNPHEFVLPSHSRTSSSASSVGSSYVSSTDSNKESPHKVSPNHSRQGSNSTNGGGGSTLYLNSKTQEENDKNVINSTFHNQNNNHHYQHHHHQAPTLPHYQQKLNEQLKEYYTETMNGQDKVEYLNTNNNNNHTDDESNSNGSSLSNGQTGYSDDGIDGIKGNYNDSGNGSGIEDGGHTIDTIYGTIRPHTKNKHDEEFNYTTLNGGIIRSVHPPGKGKSTQYKLNSNLAGPKPFNYAAGPPRAAPKSPSSFPPPNGASPAWSQPKPQPQQQQQSYNQFSSPAPAANNYGNQNFGSNTLPRAAAGHNAPEDQSGTTASLNPQSMPIIDTYEDEYASEFSRPSTSLFSWPPPPEDDHDAPTASPLYIPPPETQHAKPKISVDETIAIVDEKLPSTTTWLTQQSRSAPELTTVNLKEHNESESCSESYTSTCTTTTTTSEEYQRMYQTNQNQYQYDQSASDLEYNTDAEVGAYPQYGSFSSGTTDLMSISGRRSVQECADSLSHVVDTSQLVTYLKELTPSAETPVPIKSAKRVEFAEPVYEAISDVQPPPPLPYSVPAVKRLSQSSIPNQTPKEWISSMVQALTTVSDEPYKLPTPSEKCSKDFSQQIQQENEIVCKEPLVQATNKYYDESLYGNCQEVCEPLCERKQICKLNNQFNNNTCSKTQSDDQECSSKSNFLNDEPPQGSDLTSGLTTASPCPVQWTKLDEDPITLPPDSVPYFPPPISMKPYEKEDYGKKSPFLNALVTAPFRSFTPFDHDVITQLEDLPTPKEELKLIDALTVASSEPYNELNKPLPEQTETERLQQLEKERLEKQAKEVEKIISSTIETQMDRQLSAFANVSGFRSVNPFKPMPKAFISAASSDHVTSITSTSSVQSSQEQQQQQQESQLQSYQNNSTLLPPPLPSTPPPSLILEQDSTTNYKKGHATELLEQSIQKLQANDKEEFRSNAGKIISFMLESRLNDTNLNNTNNTADPSSETILPKKVFPTSPVKNKPNGVTTLNTPRKLNNALKPKPISPIANYPAPHPVSGIDFKDSQTSLPILPIPKIIPTSPKIKFSIDQNENSVSSQSSPPPSPPLPPPPPPPTTEIPNEYDNSKMVKTNIDVPISASTLPKYLLTPKVSTAANGSTCTNGNHNNNNSSILATPTTFITKPIPSKQILENDNRVNDDSIPNVGDEKIITLRQKELKSELTPEHARDRRSFIEKDTHTTNNSNSNNINTNGSITNQQTTLDIANGLWDGKHPTCCCCNTKITRGPFITALGKIWCPDHFVCVSQSCRRPLQDIGFVEEKGDLYCEYCFEKYLAPPCDKCNAKIKGDCLNAIGKHFHPECFTCAYCGKLFGNSPFFLEEGQAYCETDWNEMFTTKCFACGFPVEAGDRWVEALSHNYHSQCFNCTMCKKNLEGQSFFAKGGRPYCKNHAR